MRSALYYPHTEIRNPNLLKSSLLLWDHLEYIVPDATYKPKYKDKQVRRAMELIGVAHYPTEDEKKSAHENVEELFTRPNVVPVICEAGGKSVYQIYPEKFLPETLTMMKDLELAVSSAEKIPERQPVLELSGLLLMSLLADACAGETRARVTDRAVAYANLTNFLVSHANSVDMSKPITADAVVPLTLELINVSELKLEDLIKFRKRERKSGSQELRHNYVSFIEKHLGDINRPGLSKSDYEELTRQFKENSQNDVKALKQELGLVRTENVFSPVIVTVLVGAGVALANHFGFHLDVPSTIGTGAGVVIAVGGMLSPSAKYAAARKAILQKHPMAFMYEQSLA